MGATIERSFGCQAVAATVLTLGLACHANAAEIQGSDLNTVENTDSGIQALLSANRGSNGGGDQSLQFGDAVYGTASDDVLIGALGVDILLGGDGDDVIVGGTEDFNPLNRDRALGGRGDDTFIWAPGDGNDFFDGGSGVDVLILGVLGEQRDADGSTDGAPFFNVNPPNGPGSGDFDGIYIDTLSTGLPIVDVSNSPGFCEVVDGYDEAGNVATEEQAELESLGLDHLVRFVLRGPADAFEEALRTDPNLDPDTLDTGLRIAMHLRHTEFLVCNTREGGSVLTLNLMSSPPEWVDISALPARAFNSIRH